MVDHIVLERSVDIHASTADMAAAIADVHRRVEWSTFEGLDPALQRTSMGSSSGVGATSARTGDLKAGAGRMAVTEASDEVISVRVNVLKPFRSESQSPFTIAPTATGAHVSWRMAFEQTLAARAMSLVVPNEKIPGPELAKGLEKLKAMLEP